MPWVCPLKSLTSGEIVKLGPGVTQFKPGQKVLTFVRIGPGIPHPDDADVAPYGAAQEYFLTQASVSWLFDMPDEQAVTIPLTLCTAGDGLYNKMQLPLPGEEPCGVPILIWGASSQVGIQAIQCAKQSGCSPVIATASPKVHLQWRY
jgi:NADPH:quinone reductase-like Zn-dependent oxidoreductase